MSASVLLSAGRLRRSGRLWRLPGCGRGNGLDDGAWAPVMPHLAHELDSRSTPPSPLSRLVHAPGLLVRAALGTRHRRWRGPRWVPAACTSACTGRET